jgi:hypothetical protein
LRLNPAYFILDFGIIFIAPIDTIMKAEMLIEFLQGRDVSITIDELNEKEEGFFKFVEVGEKIVFEEQIGSGTQHVNMVSKEELDSVTGAGAIFLFSDYWRFHDRGSDSIAHKIGRPVSCKPETEEKLKSMITREWREDRLWV